MPITRRGFLKGLGAALGGLIAGKADAQANREDDWMLPEAGPERYFPDHYEIDPPDDDPDGYFFRPLCSPSVFTIGWVQEE